MSSRSCTRLQKCRKEVGGAAVSVVEGEGDYCSSAQQLRGSQLGYGGRFVLVQALGSYVGFSTVGCCSAGAWAFFIVLHLCCNTHTLAGRRDPCVD